MDFLKCDVEGAEMKVVLDATAYLTSPQSPVLVLEMKPWSTTLWGYTPEEPVKTVLVGSKGHTPYWLNSQTGRLDALPERIGFRLNAVFVPTWALSRLKSHRPCSAPDTPEGVPPHDQVF